MTAVCLILGASPFRKDSARDFDTMSVSSEVSDVVCIHFG